MKKSLKKIIALAFAMIMVLAMSLPVFAAGDPSITISPNDTEGAAEGKITITYTYYKILEADIETDPTVGADGKTTNSGTAAYYVTDPNKADAIKALTTTEGKKIFNVTKVEDGNRWYVELNKDTNATGEQIADAFNNDTFLANFEKQEFENVNGDDAVLPGISAGYYFIKSSLGSKMAVQTLSPVTINEKNEYVTDDKTIPEVDKNSEIGQEITYTLTVNVPVTATEEIVLTDTMSKGLTFKRVTSQKIGDIEMTEEQKGAVSDVKPAENDATATYFTITYTADQIKALVADGTEKTIKIEVEVIVNDEAEIDTNIPNTLDLKYGNNYQAKPKTVNTKTTYVDFDKVDGTDSTIKLTGAEFKLTKNTENTKDSENGWIKLVEVEPGATYRIATDDEINAGGTVDKIVTNGKTVRINGLDVDDSEQYYLVETKAPTGYNILENHVELTKQDSAFVHQDISNNKGSTLPSTGGMGTTIFYIIGGVLVLAAAIVLISKRRVQQ